jgi:hypothetical protein
MAKRTPSQFLDWLVRIQEGADVSLIVTNESGKLNWTLHAEGLPQHVGAIHVEGSTAEDCARLAELAMAAAVLQRLKARAEEKAREQALRAERCPFWDKKRYGSQREAADALAVLARTHGPEDHIPVAAYYCDPQGEKRGCGWWHLTSHPRTRTCITEPLAPLKVSA